MNEYTKSEKKFSVMMATAAITCDMISGCFNRCEERSAPLLESMHLHLAEMPPEKKARAVERTERALRNCRTGPIKGLNAEVRAYRTNDTVRIVFSTGGFGDITADINHRGDVKIAS